MTWVVFLVLNCGPFDFDVLVGQHFLTKYACEAAIPAGEPIDGYMVCLPVQQGDKT